MKYLTRLAALIALALAASGCFNTSPPPTPPMYTGPDQYSGAEQYPGPDEYAAYGYSSDPSFVAYNPFLYCYYWPVPYYSYWNFSGSNDHDCDDGYCGPRVGKPPHLPWTVGSLPQRRPPGVGAASTSLATTATHLWTAEATHAGAAPSTGFSGFHGFGAGFSGFHGFSAGGFHGFSAGGFHGGGHR